MTSYTLCILWIISFVWFKLLSIKSLTIMLSLICVTHLMNVLIFIEYNLFICIYRHDCMCTCFLFQHFPALIRFWIPFEPRDKFWTEKNGYKCVMVLASVLCVCGWRGMSVEFLAALRPWTASWNQGFVFGLPGAKGSQEPQWAAQGLHMQPHTNH